MGLNTLGDRVLSRSHSSSQSRIIKMNNVDKLLVLIVVMATLFVFLTIATLQSRENQYQSCLTYAIEHKMTIEDKIKVCG
jgi:hypothetical protein